MSESHFKPNQFQGSPQREKRDPVSSTGTGTGNANANDDEALVPRVVKTQARVDRVVDDFLVRKLSGPQAEPTPPQERPSAAVPQPARNRFQLSQLTREALGLDEAERRRVEQAVAERVSSETEVARAIGIKEGYVVGVERGRQEALDEHRRSSTEKAARLDALLASMEAAKTAVFEANQKFLIDLCFRTGRALLLRELASDREYVTRLARELIERIGIRENLTLKLNPADAELIEELRGSLQATFGAMRNLALEVSPDVSGGGAILETEWGAIDASLDTQLSNILSALQASPREGV